MKIRTSAWRGVKVGYIVATAIAAISVTGLISHNINSTAAATKASDGTKSVIVKFKNIQAVTDEYNASAQRAAISVGEAKVTTSASKAPGYKEKTRVYENLPYAVYTVDSEGEKALANDPNVELVTDNQFHKPNLNKAIPTIGGDTTTGFSDGSASYTGKGFAVAIIDSGVESNHSMLNGKVVSEACFGENQTSVNATVTSFCAGGAKKKVGPGSAAPCTISGCDHGTGVAATAAGATISATTGDGNATISGVAKDSDIIAIQAFSKINSPSVCGSSNPCIRVLSSSYLAALDHVLSLSINNTVGKPIAAVNMSIGGAPFYGTQSSCNTDPGVAAVNSAALSLKKRGIATVVAAGNSGDLASNANKIGQPSCASEVIAVAATNQAGTALASYSNNGPLTDLLAPGGDYDGSDPGSAMWTATIGNGVDATQGTSFASPVAAGSFAVLREKHPNASVNQLLSLLQKTGTSVTDTRAGYTVGAKKLIKLNSALAATSYPAIVSLTGPTDRVNEGSTVKIVAQVSNTTSCSLNNNFGKVVVKNNKISQTVPVRASYKLTCVNEYGDVAQKTLSMNVNKAPTTPPKFKGTTNQTKRSHTITWNASTDSDGIAGYNVYLDGELVKTLAASARSYTFKNMQPNTKYTLAVRAVDTLGAMSTAAQSTFKLAAATQNSTLGVPNTGVLSLSRDGLLVRIAFMTIAVALAIGLIQTWKSDRQQ